MKMHAVEENNDCLRMRVIKISTISITCSSIAILSHRPVKFKCMQICSEKRYCLILTMPMAVLGRVLFGLAPPPPTKWLGAALEGRWALLPAALVGLPRAILVLLIAVPGLWRTIALPGRRIAPAPRASLSTTPYPSDVARCCLLCCSLASMTLAGEDLGLVRRLCGSAGELDRRFVGR